MSQNFYSENEENSFVESLNDFEYLFKNYRKNPPSLQDALYELFLNAGSSKQEAQEIYDHLYLMCDKTVNQNWNSIKMYHPEISKEESLVISSYTYEPKPMYKKYGPYRLLNTNLVANDRKSGVVCIEKYFFLFLSALRKVTISKPKNLFRCINCKVKLEKDENNIKYIPFVKGNEKIFWPFTSTSDDEKIAESFLENGTGTKFILEGDNLWGYDITLFNVYGEKEILLEPERKYIIEDIKEGQITEVKCKVIGNHQIMKICGTLYIVSCYILIFSVL